MHDLVADGNSVILVDHDTQILKEADWMIEMGPEAGAKGGHVIAEGTIADLEENPACRSGRSSPEKLRRGCAGVPGKESCSQEGGSISPPPNIHTVKPFEVDIPKGRLTVVTGVSGSGKTTMMLESLVPALDAKINGSSRPHISGKFKPMASRTSKLIDATPIGINVRSTVATYAGVHDELRKLYAKSTDAKAKGLQGK